MNKLVSMMLAALACLGMAACGSDSSSDSKGDAAKLSGNAGASAGADLSDFCQAQAGAQAAGDQPAFDPNNPGAALAEAQKQLKENGPKIKAGLSAGVAAAPAEIKADVKTVAEASLPYYEALEKADYDMSKVDFTNKSLAGMTAPNVQEAAQRVAAYYTAKCGTP